jgi:hypothetical protein
VRLSQDLLDVRGLGLAGSDVDTGTITHGCDRTPDPSQIPASNATVGGKGRKDERLREWTLPRCIGFSGSLVSGWADRFISTVCPNFSIAWSCPKMSAAS